jgi:hypothetical protein
MEDERWPVLPRSHLSPNAAIAARIGPASRPLSVRRHSRRNRRYWPPEKPEMVTSMDFAIWDGERVKVLYAFVNPPTG